MMVYYLKMFGVSLLLTQVIELLILVLFRKYTKKDAMLMILVNILTNPAAVYLAMVAGTQWVQIPIELLVVVVEAWIYRSFEVQKPIKLAVTANGISWLLGMLI